MAKASAFARLKEAESPAVPPKVPLELPTPNVSKQQANRIGRKTVIFYDLPEAVKELKRVAVDHDRTIQDLMHEAVDDLLVKYGRHAFGKR